MERWNRSDARLHQLEREVASLNDENDLLNAKLINARVGTERSHRKWLFTVIVTVVTLAALLCSLGVKGPVETPSSDVGQLQIQLARCHETVKRVNERNEALMDEMILRDIEAADISDFQRARWWRKFVALGFICLVAYVTWRHFLNCSGEMVNLK